MNVRALLSASVSPGTRARLIRLEHAVTRSPLMRVVAHAARPFLMRRYARRPHEIDIEVTSTCDADCIMCPRKAMSRRMGPMSFAVFAKIVDEALALDVRELHLNGYGEISTLKRARDYLAYIRGKSRRVKIVINTNGMRMTEALAAAYVEFAVDTVNITIDGATAATYESIRKHLRLDDVERNVRRLVELRDRAGKRHPLIMVQMISMPQNAHETDLFLRKWTGVVDHVGISGLVSRIGSVDFARRAHARWEETPCFLLWRQMPILSDGTVALCCDDWDGAAGLGNVTERAIADIWTDATRRRLRALHLEKRGAAIPLCDGCQQPRRGPWWFSRQP
jgi:wyosine [tRNA(Phe)-imidazoG37] synthetase (radical SAM superfamily)